MTNWVEEYCSVQPDEVQSIAPDRLIQRKDIKEIKHEAEDDRPAWREFVCLSRTLSTSEYTEILKEKAEATDAYIDMVLNTEEV